MASPYPHRHSYGKFFLKEKGIRIENLNGKSLFESPQLPLKEQLPKYFFYKFKQPKLKVGSFEISKIKEEISYQDLREFNLIINSYGIKKRLFPGQQKLYKIESIKKESENTLKKIPHKHKILFDPINKAFLLKGKNSEEIWYFINHKKKEDKEDEYGGFVNSLFGEEREEENFLRDIEIEGIPVGISHEERKLVCIPRGKEPDHIGFIGTTGSGKSIGMHMICDFLFNKYDNKVVYIEWKAETMDWNLPTKNLFFISILNKLNIAPIPLPTIYLFPNMDDKPKNILGGEEGIGFYMALEFESIIKYFKRFTKGSKGFDLRGSEKYFLKIQNRLGKCKNRKQVISVINTIGSTNEKEFKRLSVVRRVLFDMVDVLISREITNLNTKACSKLCVKKMINNAVISKKVLPSVLACIYAGLFPILNPKRLEVIPLGNKSILPSYLDLLIKEIYNYKKEDESFKDEWIYIAIDELKQLISMGISDSIIEAIGLGRSEGIGIIYTTPQYSELPDIIKTNTNYLFCMQLPNNKEINAICNDKGASDYIKKKISRLETFESIIFPQRPLIVYSLDDGKKELRRKPIKIKLIPPLSRHQIQA